MIQVDNPDALDLLKAKLKRLETNREQLKRLNQHTRAAKGDKSLLAGLLASDPLLTLKDPERMAVKLLTPDFAGRIGIPAYELTNLGATIRQVKQRIASLPQIQAGFEPFTVGPVAVEMVMSCSNPRSKVNEKSLREG